MIGAAVKEFAPPQLRLLTGAADGARAGASVRRWRAAAATGAIAGAAVVLGKRAIIDVPTTLIGILTCLVLIYVKRILEPLLIIAAGIVGLLLTPFGGA